MLRVTSWTDKQWYAWGRPIAGVFGIGSTFAAISYLVGGDWLVGISTIFMALACLCCVLGITAHKNGNKSSMQNYIVAGVLSVILFFSLYIVSLLLRSDEEVARDVAEGTDPNVVPGLLIIVAVIGLGFIIFLTVLIRRRRKEHRKELRRQAWRAGNVPPGTTHNQGGNSYQNPDYHQGPFIS